MADQKELPEGTDTVIAGASVTSDNEEQMIEREPRARDKVLEKVKEARGSCRRPARPACRGLP